MNRLLLLINTVKYLKWQQIYFRLVRKCVKPKITDNFDGLAPLRPDNWEHFTLYEDKIDKDFNVCFLNHSKQLDLPTDWNNVSSSKLWLYNLHYFEDLLSHNAEEKRDLHRQLLTTWVDENPVGYGNGWEPYPMSLRVTNILKAWFGGLDLDDNLFKSVHSQISFLSNDLEKHLLGNHYFVNLKALFFAGVIFNNRRWSQIAEKGLLAEIPEQILQDGANFELSPMYHSLILVDMLDMFNLCKAYPNRVSYRLEALLSDNIPKMLEFMVSMKHPCGGLSFFNDSADGIAPPPSIIEEYARKLGFPSKNLELEVSQIIDNRYSGYFCAIARNCKLLFDASPVGPDYIPGHGHADTLSFELSIGTERVIVNSGTSEYGLSKRRFHQRRTRSHNTIEVDNNDSSQVWSGFRVAKRARVIERRSALNLDKSIILKAAHDGYKSTFGGCTHSRELNFDGESLIVDDELQGHFSEAKSRFYFHPKLKVSLEGSALTVTGNSFTLKSDLTGKKASLFDAAWHPEFGVDLPNKGLLINMLSNKERISFVWTKVANTSQKPLLR